MAQPILISRLTFYLVPCAWMTACLPFLMGRIDQRPTIKIANYSLVLSGEVSDEEQDNANLYTSRVKNKVTMIRSDIQHQRDFYCVGSNVWGLVSEKFGFDIELGFKVVSHEQGILAINLGSQKVLIPATGRFDYQPVARIPTDVVPDEEDDDLVSFDGTLVLLVRSIHQPVSRTYSFPALQDCHGTPCHNHRMTLHSLRTQRQSFFCHRRNPQWMNRKAVIWKLSQRQETQLSSASATEADWET